MYVKCRVLLKSPNTNPKPHVLGARKLVRSLAVGLWLGYSAPLNGCHSGFDPQLHINQARWRGRPITPALKR